MGIHLKRFFNATADSVGRIGGNIIWPFSKEWQGLATILVTMGLFAHN